MQGLKKGLVLGVCKHRFIGRDIVARMADCAEARTGICVIMAKVCSRRKLGRK